MRKIILAILLAMSIDGMAQNIDNDSINWTYLKNAIDSGAIQFRHKTGDSDKIQYVLKVLSVGKDTGEFSIKPIFDLSEFDALTKNTMCRVVERQIIVICDHTPNSLVDNVNQFTTINDSIKSQITKNLGQVKKGNDGCTFVTMILVEYFPVMVVKYNKDRLYTTYYRKQDDADDIYVYDY